jgi:hypothetical protein
MPFMSKTFWRCHARALAATAWRVRRIMASALRAAPAHVVTVVLAVSLAMAGGGAQAVPVGPGQTVLLPGSTLLDRPDLAGLELHSDPLEVRVGHPIAPDLFFAGWEVRQRVVRSDNTGALMFSFQLLWDRNITPGDFLVDAIWLDGWGTISTDVDYRTDLDGDRGPTWASRSANGQRLDMGFGFPLVSGNLVGDPQEDSLPMAIATDAMDYTTTGALTVVGRFSDRPGEVFVGRVEGLAVPLATAVPEAAPLALMAMGFAAWAMVRRRTIA